MRRFAVMFLLVGVYLPAGAYARCDDDEAKRVLGFGAVDCPAGVGIAAGRAYASDGGRYRAVYIAYTDPASGVTVYAQLVRGPRNPRDNFDPNPPRYAVDVCIYGSDGPGHPLFQQMGGDESVSACCNADDMNDYPDDGTTPTCPEPSYYPLPMAAPPGQDWDLETQARAHLVDLLTSADYPWLKKWDMLRAALAGSHLKDDAATRAAMDWITGEGADGARARIAPGANGEVRFFDGTHFPAMPDADAPSVPLEDARVDNGRKNWRQIVVVAKKRLDGTDFESRFCKTFGFSCEHSGTYGIERTQSTWWEYGMKRCNHGGCPAPDLADYDPRMQAWCVHDSVYYNRWYHIHDQACWNSLYDPTGVIYGHVCNDDTELQYHAVRDNFHPNVWGYPCYDIYRHWTATPCW